MRLFYPAERLCALSPARVRSFVIFTHKITIFHQIVIYCRDHMDVDTNQFTAVLSHE